MGYMLPSEVPGWKVEVYGLAISIPYFATKVGWFPSRAHPVKVFKSERAAQNHAYWVADRAKDSLIPIKWEGRISRVSREPDFWDKLKAFLNMRPSCGALQLLYETRLP